jgi:cyclohexanone monooxygenase
VLDDEIIKLIGTVDFDVEELRARIVEERDRRRRPDGLAQFVQVTPDLEDAIGDDPFADLNFTREPVTDHVDVIVIGAGFGGLLAGARLRGAGVDRIRLIDRAGDVGGVWYWNRYPGCQCDVESYIYLPLLEEMGYVPTQRFASASEILEYSRRIARRFDLYDDALFQTMVTAITWDESASRWIVETDRGDRTTSQFVVMANGPMDKPKLPGIPGIRDFRGHTFHTSRWDYEYTGGGPAGNMPGLADKVVGIIGTGASAVQCIPYLGKYARQLYVFQRTPAMVGARDNTPTDVEWFTSLQNGWYDRRRDQFTMLSAGVEPPDVDALDDYLSVLFRSVMPTGLKRISDKLGRPLTRAEVSEILELESFRRVTELHDRVDELVEEPETAALLKPWWRVLCKRPCPNDEYLQTFNRPSVTLVDTGGHGVDRITERGVVVGEEKYELDCLIYASGFEVGTPFTRRAGYDMVGRGGQVLSEHWSAGPRTFHGQHVHGFPNCIIIGFLQTALYANVTHMLDEQAIHAAYIIAETRSRGSSSFEATEQAEQDWVNTIQNTRSRTRFEAECTPSYYNSEGDLDNPWGLVKIRYGPGPLKLHDLLAEWRDAGRLEGLDLR